MTGPGQSITIADVEYALKMLAGEGGGPEGIRMLGLTPDLTYDIVETSVRRGYSSIVASLAADPSPSARIIGDASAVERDPGPSLYGAGIGTGILLGLHIAASARRRQETR